MKTALRRAARFLGSEKFHFRFCVTMLVLMAAMWIAIITMHYRWSLR